MEDIHRFILGKLRPDILLNIPDPSQMIYALEAMNVLRHYQVQQILEENSKDLQLSRVLDLIAAGGTSAYHVFKVNIRAQCPALADRMTAFEVFYRIP